MTATMRALRITAPGQAEVVEQPLLTPASGEVLLEVEAVATCPHWDRHIFEGRPMFEGMALDYPYWPGQPGHEAIGRVAALGEGVPEALAGQRVAVWRSAGHAGPGLYATHGLVPSENTVAIPENLPADKITSLELAMCVQVSVDQLNDIGAVRDRRLVVSGLGPGGLVALQLLRAAGAAEIWGIDPEASRRETARALGADRVVAPGDPALPSQRMAPDAFHAALDTTGLPAAIEPLLAQTRRAVAIFGVLREPVRFGPAQWYGGFSLLGYGEHNRGAADRALDAILAGALDLSALITHRLPLTRYAESVALLPEMAAIKVLFDPRA